MSEPKEVIYDLTSPFEYAYKGDVRTASFITLKEPTIKQHTQLCSLENSIFNVYKNVTEFSNKSAKNKNDSDDDGKDNDKGLDSESVIQVIFYNDAVDVNVIFAQAKELFKIGGALVDGEQVLNYPLIDKMSITDFRNIVGEYIANFIKA